MWQIEQYVEDDQHNNKKEKKTVQDICHNSSDVWIWVLVSTERGRKEDPGGRNELSEKNSEEEPTMQDS